MLPVHIDKFRGKSVPRQTSAEDSFKPFVAVCDATTHVLPLVGERKGHTEIPSAGWSPKVFAFNMLVAQIWAFKNYLYTGWPPVNLYCTPSRGNAS